MDTITWIWLLGLLVFVVLEAVTYQIVSVWFALGAAGALIAKAVGADFTIQIIVFIAVSGICGSNECRQTYRTGRDCYGGYKQPQGNRQGQN